MRPPSPASSVESVLDTLRRGQRQLARDRRAVEVAVKQLLSLGRTPSAAPRSPAEGRTYRIDDLAQATNTTVRNIRAYQERGLLHPPKRVGRVAIFDASHVSRLKIITSMLDRGYTSGHILEMLTAWEHGKDLSDVLGLEKVLVPAEHADPPETVTVAQARTIVGGEAELDQLVEAGLVELHGTQARMTRPDLVRAFAEMRAFGVPTADLIRLHLTVSAAVDGITEALVHEGARQLGHHFVSGQQPTGEEVGELVAMLTRFRALAMTNVTATLAASMDRTIEGLLSEYLAQFLTSPTVKSSRDAG